MDLNSNHARFHFDPHRGEGSFPSLMSLEHWCVDQLSGDPGADVREIIGEASRSAALSAGRQGAVKDVANAAARAMRLAAREIHDIAREFGYDPTTHKLTCDACVRICLALVSAAAGRVGGRSGDELDGLAGSLIDTVRITSEALAVTALAYSMIERGQCDYALLATVREDVSPATATMIDGMWGRTFHDWSDWCDAPAWRPRQD